MALYDLKLFDIYKNGKTLIGGGKNCQGIDDDRIIVSDCSNSVVVWVSGKNTDEKSSIFFAGFFNKIMLFCLNAQTIRFLSQRR
jgi:hypothetical protein